MLTHSPASVKPLHCSAFNICSKLGPDNSNRFLGAKSGRHKECNLQRFSKFFKLLQKSNFAQEWQEIHANIFQRRMSWRSQSKVINSVFCNFEFNFSISIESESFIFNIIFYRRQTRHEQASLRAPLHPPTSDYHFAWSGFPRARDANKISSQLLNHRRYQQVLCHSGQLGTASEV